VFCACRPCCVSNLYGTQNLLALSYSYDTRFLWQVGDIEAAAAGVAAMCQTTWACWPGHYVVEGSNRTGAMVGAALDIDTRAVLCRESKHPLQRRHEGIQWKGSPHAFICCLCTCSIKGALSLITPTRSPL
jgi:hypothetical protein